MKRIFLLKGLDCPNCSAKIEKEVGELDGVQSSVVNLMKQTLTINVTQTAADTIASQIETIVYSHEPDVEVQEETVMNVTKSYSLKGLDCPNCSAKIEKEVGELDGVQSSVVNLMKQTLTINVAPVAANTIASQIETIVHSHEPDVEVSEIAQEYYIPAKKQDTNTSYNNEDKKLTIRLAIGAAIYGIGMALTVFAKVPLPIDLAFLIVSYVILGGDVVWQDVRNISKGRVFDEHFLMSVSTIGAFVIGEYPEAVAVMLFYQVGEFFQSLAVERSRKSISDLMDIRPDCATVRRNGELITISPESVAIGEIIIVKPGEKIPLDGVVLDGDSMPCLTLMGIIKTSVPGPTGWQNGCTMCGKPAREGLRSASLLIGDSTRPSPMPSSGQGGSGEELPSGTRGTPVRRRAGSASRQNILCGEATDRCRSTARCLAFRVCSAMGIPRTASM